MSHKDKVRKRFPGAFAAKGLVSGKWFVFAIKNGKYYNLSSDCVSPFQAWKLAATWKDAS